MTMSESYALIDPVINDWVERHSFRLFTAVAGDTRPIRRVYLSSMAGDVFQIWIDEPVNGRATVYAACIEGSREDDDPQQWSVDINVLGAALEDVLQVVLDWMLPSTRYISAKTAL